MSTEREEAAEPPVPVRPSRGERQRMSVVVLLLLSVGATFLVGRFLWPFTSGIILALVLAMLSFPAYEWLCRRMPNQSVAALVGTTVLVVLVMLPVAAVSTIVFTSIQDNVDMLTEELGELTESGGPLEDFVNSVAGALGLGEVDLGATLGGQIEQLGTFFAGHTLGIMTGLGGILVQAGVAIFTLYYLLEDGRKLVDGFKRFVPLDEELTDALVHRSREIIFATVYGHIVVAIVQGVLAGLTWWALGLPGAALWGTMMLVFALLPALGPPVVWVPAAVVLFLQGQVWRAVALTGLGVLVIGTIDNVLRAYLVADRAQLHPLVGFFSVLGGLLMFGLMGIFLGPMVFVLALTILEVTRRVLNPDSS